MRQVRTCPIVEGKPVEQTSSLPWLTRPVCPLADMEVANVTKAVEQQIEWKILARGVAARNGLCSG